MYQKGKLDKTADLVYKEGMKTVLAKVGLWTVSIVCFALLGAFVYINVIGFFEDEEVSAESECKKACEHCWQEDPRGTGWFDCEVDDVCYEDCVSHWPDWPVVGGYNLPTPIPTPSPIPSGDEKQGESTCPPCPEEGGDFYGYWTWECVEQCESLQTHIEDMFDLSEFPGLFEPPDTGEQDGSDCGCWDACCKHCRYWVDSYGFTHCEVDVRDFWPEPYFPDVP